jgi:cation diffusion facilitator CzcD-associated flavoprotein CzcO
MSATSTTTGNADLQDVDVDVAIVGSGFSGLCMAIKLKEAGIRNFVALEKDPVFGGTWRVNHYPGATCDVPSRLYSFSFALSRPSIPKVPGLDACTGRMFHSADRDHDYDFAGKRVAVIGTGFDVEHALAPSRSAVAAARACARQPKAGGRRTRAARSPASRTCS